MGKLAKMGETSATRSPIQTTGRKAFTYEGHLGALRDVQSELFVLAASNLVSENTFYEGAADRDDRYRALIHAAMGEDPAWIAGLAHYLRTELNMRSAALVMAAEYAYVHGPGARKVVSSVLVRPDEPGSLLGYWFGTYGRALPAAVKRGIADALPRLYTERNTIKYDGKGQVFRFGDVIELTHPKPTTDEVSVLYRHLVDRAHDHADEIPIELPMLRNDARMWALSPEHREDLATMPGLVATLGSAGMTWERYASWIGRPLNSVDWAALVPSMGLMAIVRNLRNMDAAGVSDETTREILAKLGNVEDVKRSRQLPFRYYTAWREVQSLRWGAGLERALELSLENVPELAGRSLILIDHSGSMSYGSISSRSTVRPVELADVFGVALAIRADKADLFVYDNDAVRIPSPRAGASLLRTIEKLPQLGGGTRTLDMIARYYDGHDRVIVVTDEQAFGSSFTGQVAAISVPIYTFNINGYRTAQFESSGNRHTFAGLSDASFTMLKALEAGRDGHWPWEGAAV